MEIVSKHWLLAALWSLASATSFFLGFGVPRLKFGGKSGPLIENVLIFLLAVWIVLLLIVGTRK
jgi:hypothetical protein